MATHKDDYFPVSEDRRDQLLAKVVDVIARYELYTPAALFLSMGKPLAFVGSQLMFLLAPFASLFVEEEAVEEYAHILSDRSNVDRLLDMMEEREHAQRQERKQQEEQKKGKGKQGFC